MTRRRTTLLVLGVLLALLSMVSMAAGRVWVPLSDWLNPGDPRWSIIFELRLPRTILEAAACGRAIITTDVPGCRSFVRDGQDGRVVPVDDPAALAKALMVYASAPALAERMGASARARLLDGFTERDVMNGVKNLYRGLLAQPTTDVAA